MTKDRADPQGDAAWLREIAVQGVSNEFSDGAKDRLERIADRLTPSSVDRAELVARLRAAPETWSLNPALVETIQAAIEALTNGDSVLGWRSGVRDAANWIRKNMGSVGSTNAQGVAAAMEDELTQPVDTNEAPLLDEVEVAAKAIYDAEDPFSGDSIATVIHLSEHLFCRGETMEEQLSGVMEICRVAARAALEAIRNPSVEGMSR